MRAVTAAALGYAASAATTPLSAGKAFSIAPMMKHTHAFHRSFMKLVAPTATLFSEMVTADEVLAAPESALLQTYLELEAEDSQGTILQLGGRDPEPLASAVEVASTHPSFPFSRFNLNVGCPSDTVATKHAFGCSLMLEPDLTAACCAAMKAAAPGAEISVKCRVGVDDCDSEEELHQFISTVHERGGVDYFQIHARKAIRGLAPRSNRSVPPLCYDHVYGVARAFPHLRIEINGGIETIHDAQGHLEACPELAGVMVGRAVVNHPYSFVGGLAADTRPRPSRGEILDAYIDLVSKAYQPVRGASSSVARAVAPAFNLFVGVEGGASQRFQRKLTTLSGRGISSPALILREARRELGQAALDSTSFKSPSELLADAPWLHLSKRSHSPMKANIL